jgi:hypothetical protein
MEQEQDTTPKKIFGPSLFQLCISTRNLNLKVKEKLSKLKPSERKDFADYCNKQVELVRFDLKHIEESEEKWIVKEQLYEIAKIANDIYRSLFPL